MMFFPTANQLGSCNPNMLNRSAWKFEQVRYGEDGTPLAQTGRGCKMSGLRKKNTDFKTIVVKS